MATLAQRTIQGLGPTADQGKVPIGTQAAHQQHTGQQQRNKEPTP